jgi:ParB family chromosome partitioning protein
MNRRPRITTESAQETFTSLTSLLAPVEVTAGDTPGSGVLQVELCRLKANPDQPRRPDSAGFSTSSLNDLAENIEQHGILQPLLVKKSGRFYQIVAGERRFRAAQLIGLEQVPVRVIEPADAQEELQIALAENLQRKNLGPLEEALAFQTLVRRFGLSYRDLAQLAGRSAAHVHGRLQLLSHDDVREAVEAKRIGIADAIHLARVPDEAQRRQLLAAVEDGALKGAALHRQVQVFLGEIAEEEATEVQAPVAATGPDGLQGALSVVERLGTELSDVERSVLHAIAAQAAQRLSLQLVESPEPTAPSVPAAPSAQVPEPRPAQASSPEARKAIHRMKEYRTANGYTLANVIRVYWMTLERRGYRFVAGEWSAVQGGEGRYLVSFSYRLDGEERSLQWWYGPEGTVEAANEDARSLSG